MAKDEQAEITITREFDTTREKLWDAFTKPEQIEKWFGPEGFTTRVPEFDLRVGGKAGYVMTGPDGAEYPFHGFFREVSTHERVVATDEWGEGVQEAMKTTDLPQGMITTEIFEDLGDRSKLTIKIAHPTAEERKKHEDMGVVAGWQSSFDRLDRYIAEQKAA
jgi:uncharacterized protein YndB with AHSA1/START domain